MKKINFLIILAIVTVNTSFCQKTKWINFTVTNNPYYTLAISESNIWACSDGGIIQINRETENLTIHNHANSNFNFNPSRVFIDSEDNVWFYSTSDIGIYKNSNWNAIELIDTAGELDHIKKMVVTNENKIYLLTYYNNSVLELINDTTQLIYKSDIGWPNQSFSDIEIDINGNIWIAGIASVTCINATDTLVFNSTNSAIPDEYITDIFLDNYGNLWVVPEGFGDISLLMYDGNEWISWEKSVFADFDILWNTISEDNNGVIYLSSRNGIFKYENGNWIKSDEISTDCLVIDSDDNLWCISQGNIKEYIGEEWKSYDQTNNELDDYVNNCLSKNINSIYIGGKSGVAIFDGTIWEKHSGVEEVSLIAVTNNGTAMALIGNEIKITFDFISWQSLDHVNFPTSKYGYHKIFNSSDNTFWIGTNNGLFHFENNLMNKELEMRINDIDQDENGNIWLATSEGLIKYNNGILQQYDLDNTNLPSNFISHISVNDSATIWLSVQKKIDGNPFYYVESYLTKFENEIIENYDTLCCGDYSYATELNYGYPIDKIIKGKENDIWINYKYSGLVHLNNELLDFYHYNNSGLADNNINDLLIDENSNVYLLHDRALSIFNKNDINYGSTEVQLNNKISIYPNPSHGKFCVNFSMVLSKHIKVNILDVSGKILYSNKYKPNSKEIHVELNNFKPGLYLINIENDNQFYSAKLLIID